MLLPLVTPEIVVGVSLFLVFTQIYTSVPRGFTTQLLGHVTFTMSYVVIIVRGRLLSIGTQFEEAARDLGATRTQAMRMVLLPQLGPGDLRQPDGGVRDVGRRLRDLVVPVDGRVDRDGADQDLLDGPSRRDAERQRARHRDAGHHARWPSVSPAWRCVCSASAVATTPASPR